MPSAVHETLGVIAGFGLGQPRSLMDLSDEEPYFNALLSAIAEQRIAGLALAAVDGGELRVNERQRAALEALVRDALGDDLRLEAFLLAVAELLRGVGIDALVHKGTACAHLDYPEPSWRSFGDVDLLVRPEHWEFAARVLATNGCERRYREPRSGFTARFGKGACFAAPNGFEIDLHRSLAAGPFGVGSVAPLWRETEAFVLGATRLRALGVEARGVAAAVHAVLGQPEPRLVPLRDLAQILHNGCGEQRLLDFARDLGVEVVVARAIIAARDRLGLTAPLPLEAWALAYEPSRREQRAIDLYANPSRSYARLALFGTAAVPGMRAKLGYARALAFPQREYLAEREVSYSRRLGRAVRLRRP